MRNDFYILKNTADPANKRIKYSFFIMLIAFAIFTTGCAKKSADADMSSAVSVSEEDDSAVNVSEEETVTESVEPETSESSQTTGVIFDCIEYENIEEMNSAAGTGIARVQAEGITDESFSVISGSIAQYKFKRNGEEWCIRAGRDTENDISGLYYDSIGFEKDIISTYYTDDVDLLRFFHDDVQYVVFVDNKNQDIRMSYFDDFSSEIQTLITGVKSGYDNEILEEGNNVIYRVVMYNADGTATTMETVYEFEDDKMISISSSTSFETEQAAKEYYDMLLENGYTEEDITLEGTAIFSKKNTDTEFYSDYTKEEFIEEMKSSMLL